jgi:hypothetical protein
LRPDSSCIRPQGPWLQLFPRFIDHELTIAQNDRCSIRHRFIFALLAALSLLFRPLSLLDFSTPLFEGVLIPAHGMPS